MAYRWTQADVDAVMKARLAGSAAAASETRRTSTVNASASATQRTIKDQKRPKYGNRKVTDADGNVHDSTKEFRRWQELQLRERAGEITGLRRQVPFALVVNGVLVCSYEADAVYHEGAALIVEDTKSEPTRKKRDYRIKVKLMKACHNIEVREV